MLQDLIFHVHFVKRFHFRVHVLLTDGRGEHKNVDFLIKQMEVIRQVKLYVK